MIVSAPRTAPSAQVAPAFPAALEVSAQGIRVATQPIVRDHSSQALTGAHALYAGYLSVIDGAISGAAPTIPPRAIDLAESAGAAVRRMQECIRSALALPVGDRRPVVGRGLIGILGAIDALREAIALARR